nr:kinesin-like protein KIN-5C [Tanacetum cinerariifolium]
MYTFAVMRTKRKLVPKSILVRDDAGSVRDNVGSPVPQCTVIRGCLYGDESNVDGRGLYDNLCGVGPSVSPKTQCVRPSASAASSDEGLQIPEMPTVGPNICDDDNSLFAMHNLPTPVSWLGSDTKSVIAAMAGVFGQQPTASNRVPTQYVYLEKCTCVCRHCKCVNISRNLQSCSPLESDLAHQAFILRSELKKSLQDNASLFMKIAREDTLTFGSRSVVDKLEPQLAQMSYLCTNQLQIDVSTILKPYLLLMLDVLK